MISPSSFVLNSIFLQENFIESNTEVFPKSLCDIAQKVLEPLHSTDRTKFGLNICSYVNGNRKEKQKTFSTTFRMELEMLISNLKQTVFTSRIIYSKITISQTNCRHLFSLLKVKLHKLKGHLLYSFSCVHVCHNSFQRSYFIRCLKPNLQQKSGFFDKSVVFNQLESSGALAYYSLMEIGYPVKIPITEFFHNLQPYLEKQHIGIGTVNCCRIFLLVLGLLAKDFKFGKTEIHIRPGSALVLNRLCFKVALDNEHVIKFRKELIAFMRRILYIRIRFLGACKCQRSSCLLNSGRYVNSLHTFLHI